MKRIFTLVLATLGIAAVALAGSHQKDGEQVKTLSTTKIVEKLDGKQATATVVEVTIEPGEAGLSHRHPGPGFGYVVEGEYEMAINDEPAKIYKAGETFYEPTGCLHRVSRNPGKVRTRLVAVVLHPREIKEIAVPESDSGQAKNHSHD
jgi:quercetin dioxygenase-like cupin family protein